LGNYETSGIEKKGLTQLFDLISSGNPEMLSYANDKIKGLSDLSKYDPRSDTSIFDAYKGRVDRQTQEGFDSIKRNAAFGGNLYSSDTVKSLSDYQTKNNEVLGSKLAELYDNFAQRELSTRLATIPLAMNSATTAENIKQNRIGSAFQYGGLERSLADTKAQREYLDWLRQREEKGQRLSAYTTLAGSSRDTTYEPSKWSGLLNAMASGGGMLMGQGLANSAKAPTPVMTSMGNRSYGYA